MKRSERFMMVGALWMGIGLYEGALRAGHPHDMFYPIAQHVGVYGGMILFLTSGMFWAFSKPPDPKVPHP
jgi:hypothetical protein